MNNGPHEGPRWIAVITYRTEKGNIGVEHDIEEIEELHGIVERGPSFLAIKKIEITYERLPQKLTVEEAAKL